MCPGQIESEARRRFPWCFPPDSDREDADRVKAGKAPRDWEPTREAARRGGRC